ncbi:MAG: hypothetical protein LBM60_06605 [Clostridium sp.]|jgi:hypothetical protein|nr:hypothetical protein [Clostridium sp.]
MKYIAEHLYPTDSTGCCQETLSLEHLQLGNIPICLGILSCNSSSHDPIARNPRKYPSPHDHTTPQGNQGVAKCCTDWLYEKGALLCAKGKTDSLIRQDLLPLLTINYHEDFAGLLLYGRHFIYFQHGNIHGYLLNQRIHSPQMTFLGTDPFPETNDETLRTRCGVLEADIGLLLCSTDFLSPYPEKDLACSLSPHSIRTGGELRRRLEELHDNHPGKDRAAICIMVRA